MKKILFLFLLLSSAVISDAQAPFTQNFSFYIKKDGSASVELVMKMNAGQWTQYKASTNAASLPVRKRDMERMLPAYLFENFKYSEDEMERTARYTFDLVGVAEYLGDNHWRIRLESKDPQIEKLSDNAFMLTSTTPPEEGSIQQIQKVFLPGNASSAKVNSDALGFAELQYGLPSQESNIPYTLLGGGVLLAAGIALFLKNNKGFKLPVRFKMELRKNEQ